MMEISKDRKSGIKDKILALWIGKENEYLRYREIIKELRNNGVSERTIARYLSTLVKEKKLFKEERGYKKTFYRPSDEFLHKLYSSYGDWFSIHEEYLRGIGREIMNRIEGALSASKETESRIEKLLSEEIDKITKENPNLAEEEILEKAFNTVLSKEKMEKSDSKALVLLIEKFLINAFYNPFSNPYGSAGTLEPPIIIQNIEHEITSLISSYLDLWSFLYKHPGASYEFQKFIQEKFPEIITIEKRERLS